MTFTRPLNLATSYTMERGDSLDHDNSITTKLVVAADDEGMPRSPFSAVAQLALSRGRFAMTTMISLAVLVTLLAVFVNGVVFDKNVIDDLGSTKTVNAKIERYQVMNGYASATVGLIMESYFEVFTVVAVTFLTNVRWYPGDEPRTGGNRVKRFCLWAFPPWIMFVLNVAITSSFVSHKTTGIARVFLHDDLVSKTTFSLSSLSASSNLNVVSLGNNHSVLDTILRGAVRHQVAPFEMLTHSPCVLGNQTNADDAVIQAELPSVKEVRSTAVVYGFPLQDWNLDAMPFGLVPEHTVILELGDVNTSISELKRKFSAFQSASKLSWTTAYEMLLQGKVLFERSISDSNASNTYPCNKIKDGSNPLMRRRRLLATKASTTAEGDELETDIDAEDFDKATDPEINESDFDESTVCRGAESSLQDLENMADQSMHTIETFVTTIVDGFVTTVPQIEPESMNLTISTYSITPQIQLTAMTLDMPYFEGTPYRNTTEFCNGNKLNADTRNELKREGYTTTDDLEFARYLLCNQASYPYMQPREACGHSNCIFLDKSRTIPFKKQLQLMPYLTNCSTAQLQYSEDYLNFFPSGCVPQENAVFLYGLGSYMAGDEFHGGNNESIPFILGPRRHVVLSFAKLEWSVEDMSHRFKAACGVNGTTSDSQCRGLIYPLENVTVPSSSTKQASSRDEYARMLVLGKDHLPADRLERDFRDPVQLVSLDTRPFYYEKYNAYYEWEYIQKSHFTNSTWPNNLSAEMCSPLVDSYIAHVERNHFYMEDPLQPLYTSALYYLFQDAAVKTVKVNHHSPAAVDALQLMVVGTTSLKGDLEKHVIKFSIPLASLISTFVGMLFLLVLVVLVLVRPTERLKMSEETNIAVQYAELLQDDQYPSKVFDRRILLPSRESVAMDEYVVESATVHFTQNADKKVFL